MKQHSFVFYAITFFVIILLRYFLVAGFSHWLLQARQWRPAAAGPAACEPPLASSIQEDIRLSVLSAAVFALATAAVLMLEARGWTLLYGDPSRHGSWYLGFSYLLVLALQDAFFYATHRLFHHRALFRQVHQGHHRSRHPTPWTSFAFDPPEAVVQALFLVAVVMLVPLHWITVLAVLSTMTIWAIVNHVGPDHLPLRFPHHWLGHWVIGPAHHSLHHCRHGVHFGLYFTFWDRLFGTEDPAYGRLLRSPLDATA